MERKSEIQQQTFLNKNFSDNIKCKMFSLGFFMHKNILNFVCDLFFFTVYSSKV